MAHYYSSNKNNYLRVVLSDYFALAFSRISTIAL
jgi:hypothetical protein